MKVVLVLLALAACVCAKKSYQGYHVLTVGPFNTETEVQNVARLGSMFTKSRRVLLWSEPHGTKEFDLVVDSELMPLFKQFAKGVPYKVHTENLQEWIDEEAAMNEQAKQAQLKDGATHAAPESYLEYDEIVSWINNKASQHSNARAENLPGQTYEGRQLRALKIGPNNGAKPKVWLDCGIHAREWISPSTCLWVANKILTEDTADARFMRDTYDWIIIPVANPDGYQYTHDWDRLWRKTRRPQDEDPSCAGADPNRNWDADWGGASTSPDPCSDIWPGDDVWSEACVRSLRDYAIANAQNMQIFVTMHSYSQYWLIPYSYTFDYPDNEDEIRSIGQITADAIEDVNGRNFLVGSPPEILYAVGGSNMDWAKDLEGGGIQGVRLTYAPELRPASAGEGGFVLPPTPHIRESGEEVYAGLVAKCRALSARL